MVIEVITNKKEIEILRGRASFNYIYDDATIELLKKNWALKDSLYLVAKRGAEFVGFCSIDRDWWEEGYFFLREILVDSSFQKLGIGQELAVRCLEHARNKKAIGVVTETARENIPMQKLCAKLGFQKWDNPKWREGITYKLIF
ncbi:MAG: GNAT family N-acetyltransferase [Patescibacteria group bacterium]|jgi:RimJ/RimL family protein N-acetyltransferase